MEKRKQQAASMAKIQPDLLKKTTGNGGKVTEEIEEDDSESYYTEDDTFKEETKATMVKIEKDVAEMKELYTKMMENAADMTSKLEKQIKEGLALNNSKGIRVMPRRERRGRR